MYMISDNQLIQQTAKGDEKAFAQLLDRYQDHIYSVCYSILKTKDEAQEAAQDSFIKVYKSADTFNQESKLSSWMYKIAYRTSLDYIRKRKTTQDIDTIAYSLADSDRNADDNLSRNELNERLMEAISELSEDEAVLIRLFYIEEMSIKDLMDICGLSLSNVKIKLFRARKKLYTIINEQYSELAEYNIES